MRRTACWKPAHGPSVATQHSRPVGQALIDDAQGVRLLVEEAAVIPDLDDDERRGLRRKSRSAALEALRSLGGEGRRDALLERALADGGFTPRELSALPPDA